AAFTKIIETVDFARVGEHRVLDDETPIQVHAEDLLARIHRDGGSDRAMYFTEIFPGRTRSECIGLFLAMLRLIRYGKLKATQHDRGSIRIALREESEALSADAAVV